MRRRAIRESAVEKAFREGCEALGGRAYKFVSPGCAGVYDRIVVLPMLPIWLVETKRPGKDLEALQILFRDELNRIGYRHHTMLDTTQKVAQWLANRAAEIRLERIRRLK